MSGSGKGLSRPATWAEAFKQGGVFLAFAIPFVGLIGMIAGAWSIKGEWGNAADWVQAIGSLIAIGIAIAVPAWQRKHENGAARVASLQSQIDMVTAMRGLLIDQSMLASRAAQELCGPYGWDFVRRARSAKHEAMLSELAHHAEVAAEVGVLSLGPEFVAYLIDYRQRASVMARISRVERVGQFAPDDPQFKDDLRALQPMAFGLDVLVHDLTGLLEKFEDQRNSVHATALRR